MGKIFVFIPSQKHSCFNLCLLTLTLQAALVKASLSWIGVKLLSNLPLFQAEQACIQESSSILTLKVQATGKIYSSYTTNCAFKRELHQRRVGIEENRNLIAFVTGRQEHLELWLKDERLMQLKLRTFAPNLSITNKLKKWGGLCV